MSNNSLYAQDGVNVSEEAVFSSFAGSVCKDSYANSPFVDVHDLSGGQFRGPRPFSFKNLPEGYTIESSSDGIGTKGILHDAAKTHHLAAYDLVAMTASDITRYGGLPLVFVNILDVESVGAEGSDTNTAFVNVMSGLGKVAADTNMVVLKGETAQMSVCLGSEISDSPTKFNWGAVMTGVYHPDKMVTGNDLAEGQIVIALKENGFRCNGISSVRKALAMQYGNEWWNNPDAADDIRAAAEPSVLYDLFVNTLQGWYAPDHQSEIPLYAIAHISGGGVKEKFGKEFLFPRGLSAELSDLWELPEIMKKCAEWRGMSDEELYEAWNGGQGMLLVVDEVDAEKCVSRAKDFGIQAKIAGKITREDTPQMVVTSKLSGETVIYNA